MKWHVLDNQRKIMGVLQKLVSNKTEIKVRVRGAKRPFTSKLLKIVEVETFLELEDLEIDTEAQLIIEKLNPAKGDDLIQSFPDVIMEFLVNKNFCQCAVRNVGVSNIPPHFGFILSFPETLEIQFSQVTLPQIFSSTSLASSSPILTSTASAPPGSSPASDSASVSLLMWSA